MRTFNENQQEAILKYIFIKTNYQQTALSEPATHLKKLVKFIYFTQILNFGSYILILHGSHIGVEKKDNDVVQGDKNL